MITLFFLRILLPLPLVKRLPPGLRQCLPSLTSFPFVWHAIFFKSKEQPPGGLRKYFFLVLGHKRGLRYFTLLIFLSLGLDEVWGLDDKKSKTLPLLSKGREPCYALKGSNTSLCRGFVQEDIAGALRWRSLDDGWRLQALLPDHTIQV